jgi:hypothetical protein
LVGYSTAYFLGSRSRAAIATLAIVAMPAVAHGQVSTNAQRAPEITIERYPEDWSLLSDPMTHIGRWTEPFKYVPASDDGSRYLTTGLEARSRYEAFKNPGWGSQPDDDYVWHRLMPYADLHAGGVRLFAQPILSAISGTDRRRTPVDTTAADILQAFAEIELPVGEATISLSAGRKLLSLGAGRFFDTRYGPNIPQPFDGIDAVWVRGKRQVRMFYTRPVDTSPGSLNDRGSRQQVAWALYATHWLGGGRTTGIDLFYLGLRDSKAAVDQGAGRLAIGTVGGRIFGEHGAWSWNFEGAVQGGSFGDKRVEAFGIGSEAGYRLSNLVWQPALALTIDYASGDRDPNDSELGTMNPMFPRGQYFVALSPVGPRNLIHARASLTVHPSERVTVSLTGGGYWRASTRDGVYNMPGFLAWSGRDSDARFISKQFDLAAGWQVTSELNFRASLSMFAPQRFIRETGTARNMLAAVASITFKF